MSATSSRAAISEAVETAILCRSRRRCCLCYFLESDNSVKEGQIAHIDRNPSNACEDNLVYLCIPHHNLYDTKYRQTKCYTPAEMRHYKKALQKDLRTAQEWELVIEGNVNDHSETEMQAIVDRLRNLFPECQITLKYVKSGSIILVLESTEEVQDAISHAFREGKLVSLGVSVLDVRPVVSSGTEELLRLCDELIDAKEFDDALACVNRAIELNPRSPSAWALKSTVLSEIHAQTSDVADAPDVLSLAWACTSRAIHLSPDDATFLSHHAGILFELGEHDEALSCSNQAVKLDRKNGFAWYNNGVILYNLGQKADAIHSFTVSLELGYERASYALQDAMSHVRRLR